VNIIGNLRKFYSTDVEFHACLSVRHGMIDWVAACLNAGLKTYNQSVAHTLVQDAGGTS
jgi:hypothetical protein